MALARGVVSVGSFIGLKYMLHNVVFKPYPRLDNNAVLR